MPAELALIAAVAQNRVIGRDGGLPWRLPEDLKRFRRLTLGHIMLMGRKTFASLGKPLDGRDNWVLTRDPSFAPPAGVRAFASLETALAAHAEAGGALFVIGGAGLFRETLPLAARLELTEVLAEVQGDVRFPEFDRGVWRETACEAHAADARHAYACRFVTLERL